MLSRRQLIAGAAALVPGAARASYFHSIDQKSCDLQMRSNSPRNDEATSTDGRVRVDPATINAPSTILLAFYGQSTNNNAVKGGMTTVAHGASIFNLSIAHRGAVFQAVEPLLSSDLLEAHHGMSLADQLIEGGHCARVVLINVSLGGSVMADWCPGGHATGGSYGTPDGVLSYRLGLAARCIANAGLDNLRVVNDWQIGEWDSDVVATTQGNYAGALDGVIAEMKQVGLVKPGNVLFVNLCTRITNASADRTGIRTAQASVVDGDLVRLGGDIDTLGADYREDGTHFTQVGAAAQAALKLPGIAAFLANG